MKVIDLLSYVPIVNGEYNIEDLLKDSNVNNISKRMIAIIDGTSISEQNDKVIEFVRNHPKLLDGCAVINPKDSNCIQELERVIAKDEIKAIMFDSYEHGYLPERTEIINELLEIIKKNSKVVLVNTGYDNRSAPDQWGYYAKLHPEINFVILHVGSTGFGYSAVNLATELDNVYLETSDQIELPVLSNMFSRVPDHKIIFGSKYPILFTKCSIITFDMLDLDSKTLNNLYRNNYLQLIG